MSEHEPLSRPLTPKEMEWLTTIIGKDFDKPILERAYARASAAIERLEARIAEPESPPEPDRRKGERRSHLDWAMLNGNRNTDRRQPSPTTEGSRRGSSPPKPSASAEEIAGRLAWEIDAAYEDLERLYTKPTIEDTAVRITAALAEHAVPLEAKIARMREAGEWVLNVVNGVSRGGGEIDPNDDEPETAFAALHAALKGD